MAGAARNRLQTASKSGQLPGGGTEGVEQEVQHALCSNDTAKMSMNSATGTLKRWNSDGKGR
eukprot:361485-Chlamydomonas_euryale.AAC.7